MDFQESIIQNNQRTGFEALLYLCRHETVLSINDQILIIAILVYVYQSNEPYYEANNKEDIIERIESTIELKNLITNYESDNTDVSQLDFNNILTKINKLNASFFEKTGKYLSKYFRNSLKPDIFYDFLIKGNLSPSLRKGRFFTPKLIAERIASLIDLNEDISTYDEYYGIYKRPADSVLDIGCGLGGILGEIIIHNNNKNCNYNAIDIDLRISLLGKMYLSLLRKKIWYHTADVFEYFREDNLAQFDWVVSDIPFGNKQEIKFIDFAIKKACKKAILIVPESFLFSNQKYFKEKRKELIKNDWLEAIISYPIGIMKPFSAVKVSLMVINKNKSNKEKGRVRFEEILSKNNNFNAYSSKKDKNFVLENKEIFISNSEVVENEYFFNTNRYFKEDIPNLLNGKLIPLGQIATLKRGVNIINDYLTTINNGCFYVSVKQLAKEVDLPYFNEANIQYCFDRKESHKFRYANADEILVSMVGESLNPTLMQNNFAYFSHHIISIKLNDKYLVSPQYLAFYLRSDIVKNQLNSLRVTGTLKVIDIVSLGNVIIEIPNADEQAKYVNEQLSKLFLKGQQVYLDEKQRDVVERANTLEHTLGSSINVIENDLKSLAKFFENLSYDPITNTKARPEVAEKSRLSNIFKRMFIEVQSSRFALQNVNDWRIVNKSSLHKERTNLKSFFEESTDLGDFTEDILIEVVCPNNLEADIDRERFKILIRNFIHNAKKHAFQDTELIDKRIIFTIFRKEDDSIQIDIQNNGKTIREDFDLNKYLNSGTNKGLKLIYNIIKAHDGSLEVLTKKYSEKLGSGAFFIIQINKIDDNGEN